MIEVKNLTKIYRVNPIVNDLSVTINDGEIISIIGPSGCGKSTFIKCLNMLEKPTKGQIFIDGEEISQPQGRHGLSAVQSLQSHDGDRKHHDPAGRYPETEQTGSL